MILIHHLVCSYFNYFTPKLVVEESVFGDIDDIIDMFGDIDIEEDLHLD